MVHACIPSGLGAPYFYNAILVSKRSNPTGSFTKQKQTCCAMFKPKFNAKTKFRIGLPSTSQNPQSKYGPSCLEAHWSPRGWKLVSRTHPLNQSCSGVTARICSCPEMEFWTRPCGLTLLPSGNLTLCYWKLPFIVDLPIENGDFPYLR